MQNLADAHLLRSAPQLNDALISCAAALALVLQALDPNPAVGTHAHSTRMLCEQSYTNALAALGAAGGYVDARKHPGIAETLATD